MRHKQHFSFDNIPSPAQQLLLKSTPIIRNTRYKKYNLNIFTTISPSTKHINKHTRNSSHQNKLTDPPSDKLLKTLELKFDPSRVKGVNSNMQEIKIRRETSNEYIVPLTDRELITPRDLNNQKIKNQRNSASILKFNPTKKSKSRVKNTSNKLFSEHDQIHKQKKNSQQIILNSKMKQILTQPISSSIFTTEKLMKQFISNTSRSFKLELDSMLQSARINNTINQQKIGHPLTFGVKSKTKQKNKILQSANTLILNFMMNK